MKDATSGFIAIIVIVGLALIVVGGVIALFTWHPGLLAAIGAGVVLLVVALGTMFLIAVGEVAREKKGGSPK